MKFMNSKRQLRRRKQKQSPIIFLGVMFFPFLCKQQFASARRTFVLPLHTNDNRKLSSFIFGHKLALNTKKTTSRSYYYSSPANNHQNILEHVVVAKNNNPFASDNCKLHSTTSNSENDLSTSNSESNSEGENNIAMTKNNDNRRRKKKRSNRNHKDKRREFIGKAKAVDRGQWSAVYSPGGEDRVSFTAKSGLPDRTKPFTVLGIESSCDDTGAALVRSDGVILGESLASQNEIHEEWGGIVPGLAKNAHEEKIDSVISEALHKAGLTSIDQVDAIGVTIGPGLEICLRVGCNKARELAIEFNKPFVGIHHLEAHILMARLPFDADTAKFIQSGKEDVHESKRAIEFPFLALLVSGGHCQLLKCLGIGNYQIIGGTIDDSLGTICHLLFRVYLFYGIYF